MSETEPAQVPVQENKSHAKSLRTYQGDVEEAVSRNKVSTTKIFVAEQKKKIEEPPTPKSSEDFGARNKFFIIVGITMLVLGIVTVGSIFYLKSRNTVVVQEKTNTLIGYSEEKTLPIEGLTREKLIAEILVEKKAFNLPVNSILYVNTVKASSTPAKIENVIPLIAPEMPSSLVRSFDNEYMIGVYSSGTNEVFIILTTDDFASSFGGMLKWEKNAYSDMEKMFSLPKNTASTTPQFEDEALRNKDLRILQDENGKTVLLYSFIDKNTLIIAPNENVFTAIMGKYNVSKQIR